MALVDEQVVDAQLFEADVALVGGDVEEFGEPGVPAGGGPFDLFHRPAGPGFAGGVGGFGEPFEFGFDVGAFGGGDDGDPPERGVGHHHRIPVPGGAAGDERPPLGLREVVAGG